MKWRWVIKIVVLSVCLVYLVRILCGVWREVIVGLVLRGGGGEKEV